MIISVRMALVRVATLLGAVLLCAPATAQAPAQEIAVRATVEQERMYVGEVQHLSIECDGTRDVENPDISGIKDFDATFRGPFDSSQQMITVINGRMTQTSTIRYTLQYDIKPKRAGQFTIPSLRVRAGGRTFVTAPINIDVQEPKTAPDARLEFRLDTNVAYVGQPVRLTVTWTFGGSVRNFGFGMPSLEGCEVLPGPDPRPPGVRPNDDRFVDFAIDQERVVGVLGKAIVNDQPGHTLTFERILIPRQPGDLTIGPGRVDYQAVIGQRRRDALDMFFGDPSVTEHRVSTTPALHLPVRALPEAGKPANFSGLVGNYGIFASLDQKQAAVGEPIPLRVSVTGPLPLSLVPPLDLSRQGRFGKNDFRIPRDPVLGEPRGNAMVFEPTVRAKSEKVTKIPPIELTFFDPSSGTYATAKTDPIAISITPTPTTVAVGLPDQDDASETATAGAAPGGLAPIDRTAPRKSSWLDRPVSLWDPIVAAAFGGPLLLLLLAMCLGSVLRLMRSDPSSERQRLALRRCTGALRAASRASPEAAPGLLARAVGNFVADWFGRERDSLTSPEVVEFVRAGAPGAASELVELLSTLDRARFDSSRPEFTPSLLSQKAAAIVSSLDLTLRRPGSTEAAPREGDRVPGTTRAIVTAIAVAVSLIAVERARAADQAAGDAWTLAVKTYDDATAKLKGGQASAVAAFGAAADAFEEIARDEQFSPPTRARAWFNAGNGALLGGQMPRAILVFRRAESLDPFIPGLAANLMAARAKIAGVATVLPKETGEPWPDRVSRWTLVVPRGVWLAAGYLPFAAGLLVAGFCGFSDRGPRRVLRATQNALVLIGIIGAMGLVGHVHALGRSADAVVLTATPVQTGPDEVVFGTGAPVAAGTEVRILESRTAESGQEWLRFRALDQAEPEQPARWLPATAIARVKSTYGY